MPNVTIRPTFTAIKIFDDNVSRFIDKGSGDTIAVKCYEDSTFPHAVWKSLRNEPSVVSGLPVAEIPTKKEDKFFWFFNPGEVTGIPRVDGQFGAPAHSPRSMFRFSMRDVLEGRYRPTIREVRALIAFFQEIPVPSMLEYDFYLFLLLTYRNCLHADVRAVVEFAACKLSSRKEAEQYVMEKVLAEKRNTSDHRILQAYLCSSFR